LTDSRKEHCVLPPIELIVAAFAAEDKADAALKHLKELQRDDVVSVVNAAVMVKTQDGRASIKETEDVRAPAGAVFGAIVGGLVGLLGGPAGVIVGVAAGAATGGLAAHEIDMGFDNHDLKEIQASLPAGSSAIIALVTLDWVEQVVQALEELDARLWRQALREDMLASTRAPRVIEGKSTPAPDAVSTASPAPASPAPAATAPATGADAK
jgi:uncharacterized membrane protein